MKVCVKAARIRKGIKMAFFNSAITVLQTLVIALGAGLGVWGVETFLRVTATTTLVRCTGNEAAYTQFVGIITKKG